MKEGFKRMVSVAGRYLLIMILIPMLSGCAGQGKSEDASFICAIRPVRWVLSRRRPFRYGCWQTALQRRNS